ncbi:MAG TPA: YoaK family protein [Thermoleophilaceae bacterium]|jgi:uncharacterized membrane protein YoaK (UPF0700 family)
MATAESAVGRRVARLDDTQVRDLLLAGLTLSSGCVDAISWFGLSKVFSAFMTGNLAFLGFRLGGGAGPSVPRVLAATAAFAAGAALAARIVRRPHNPDALWPRGVSAALAVGVAAQAAFLIFWLVVGAKPASASADVLIAFSALAMGIQTAAIFSLGVRAAFTTAATATLMVLMGDLAGWKQTSGERARLATTLVALVGGAVAGTLLMSHATSWAPAFPLLITAAVLVAAAVRLRAR